MRIALLGDIHANLPALEAVLNHAHERHVKAIWNVGDIVGYGAFPNLVIKELKWQNIISIAGNYDHKVLKFEKKQEKWRKKKRPEKFLAFQWTYNTLSTKNRQYLKILPRQKTLQCEGSHIHLTHGSPASISEHLHPDTPNKRFQELATQTDAEVIICGHSHLPFVRKVAGVYFINTGSVGRPDDGDPRACYAILNLEKGSLQVNHYRLAYDLERAINAIRGERLPESFAQMIIQGVALDEVMETPQRWKTPTSSLPWEDEEKKARLNAVMNLLNRYDHTPKHAQQVTRLALRLFDELYSLHRLGPTERFWLQCGALLHDIGWVEGRKSHHKTSLRLILEELDSPFNHRERLLIGSIARYHRRALPKDKHDHFAALSPIDQYQVTILGAILRVADGLDRTHRKVIQDLSCEISPKRIFIHCDVRMYPIPERDQALKKGDLWERVFFRDLEIIWDSPAL